MLLSHRLILNSPIYFTLIYVMRIFNINKPIAKFFLFIVLTITLLVAVTFSVFEQRINQPLLINKAQLLTVKNGTTVSKLSRQLIDKKWLKERFWLRNYPRFFSQYADIKAGSYQITQGTTLKKLLAQLVAGKEYQFEITFIEGTTFKQWLKKLSIQPYIKHNLAKKSIAEIAQLLNIKHANPEGLFFPDTYAYTAGTDELTLLRRAHKKMRSQLNIIWKDRSVDLPFDNSYQALIMASIIEKETSKVEEQPLIAAVFINRLTKKMRLQTDPTVIYGLGERYQGDITRKHLKEKTPYNTYKINGLPPTPIAMPGVSALQASLHPAQSNYLYFVSQGNGYHVFSTTLKAHNKAVKRFLRTQRQLIKQ